MSIHLLKYEIKKLISKEFFIAVLMIVISSLWISANEVGFIRMQEVYNSSEDVILSNGVLKREINRAFEDFEELDYSDGIYREITNIYNQLFYLENEDDYDFLKNKEGKYSSCILYDRYVFGNVVSRCETYNSFYDDILKRLKEANRIKKYSNNEYEMKLADKYIETYNKKYSLKLYNPEPFFRLYNIYLGENYTYVLLMFMEVISVIVICCGMFSMEKEHNTFDIIYTSVRGKNSIFFHKLVVTIIISLLFAVLAHTIPYIFVDFYCGGINGLGEPVQTVTSTYIGLPDYRNCPLPLSNMGYIALLFAIRVIVYLTIGIVSMIISLLVSKNYKSMLFGIGVVGGLFAVSYLGIEHTSSLWTIVKILNPADMLCIKQFCENFSVINMFGEPVECIWIKLSSCIVWLIVLVIISAVMYRNIKNSRRRLGRGDI